MSGSLHTVVSQILRLRLVQTCSTASIHTASAPVCIHATDSLCGNPIRKKVDVKQQQQEAFMRKMKKIGKELKQQSRAEKIKKPLEEYEVRTWLLDGIKSGQRVRKHIKFTPEEQESHILLEKEWTRYRRQMYIQEMRVVNRLERCQAHALEKLREESEELYKQAIQIDEGLVTYSFKGPVHTPPIEGYETGDGDYIDETNYFEKQEVFKFKKK